MLCFGAATAEWPPKRRGALVWIKDIEPHGIPFDPFEHSEAVGDQDNAVLLAADLAIRAPENLRAFCRYTLDYATRYRDVNRKFGRFPHRNTLLGRQSTLEENAFIAGTGEFSKEGG